MEAGLALGAVTRPLVGSANAICGLERGPAEFAADPCVVRADPAAPEGGTAIAGPTLWRGSTLPGGSELEVGAGPFVVDCRLFALGVLSTALEGLVELAEEMPIWRGVGAIGEGAPGRSEAEAGVAAAVLVGGPIGLEGGLRAGSTVLVVFSSFTVDAVPACEYVSSVALVPAGGIWAVLVPSVRLAFVADAGAAERSHDVMAFTFFFKRCAPLPWSFSFE